MAESEFFEIRRILVGLDAETYEVAALETAADLAVHLQAELAGLFVEDETLLALEEHPSARQIHLPTGFGEQIGKGAIQRDLKALAAKVEDALRQMAAQRQIEYTFDIARGELETALSGAASARDLVVIDSAGREVLEHIDLGTAARQVVHQTSTNVLFLRRGVRAPHSILVGYDGTAAGRKALDAALQLASNGMSLLTVIVYGENDEQFQQRRQEAEAELGGFQDVHYQRLVERSPAELSDAAQIVQADLTILPDKLGSPSEEFVERFLASVQGAVLFVR
jgi:nucleotide-binding universal stress UspA family protein